MDASRVLSPNNICSWNLVFGIWHLAWLGVCFRLWFWPKLFGIMEISVCHLGARSVCMQIELQQAEALSIRQLFV